MDDHEDLTTGDDFTTLADALDAYLDRLKRGEWGRWRLNRETNTLDLMRADAPDEWETDIPLAQLTTAPDALGAVFHIAGKNVAWEGTVLADLLDALEDLGVRETCRRATLRRVK